MSRIRDIYRELRGSLTTPRRVVIILFAFLCAGVGLLTIPILLFPSRVFLATALVIFSVYSPTAYRWLKQRTQKYPRVQSIADRMRNRVINLIHPTPKKPE